MDGFTNNEDLLKNVAGAFHDLQKLDNQIKHLKDLVDAQNSQKELLKYKLDELVATELSENEFDELSKSQKIYQVSMR